MAEHTLADYDRVIIGIAGRRGSGKDEVARFLMDEASEDGCTAQRIAYADALKDEVAQALALARGPGTAYVENRAKYYREMFDSRETKEKFRPILQWWGTEFRRQQFWQDYWLDRLAERFDKTPEGSVTMTPDVRFVNEVEHIRSLGGVVIRVDRRPVVMEHGGGVEAHPSETELDGYDKWDYTIDNSGSLDLLRYRVRCLWENLREWRF